MARERPTPDSTSPTAFISRDDIEHATRVVREELHRTPVLALNWLAEQEASELFTNNVLGQYAASGNYASIENPVAAEMVAARSLRARGTS